jgi:hypothetical protein
MICRIPQTLVLPVLLYLLQLVTACLVREVEHDPPDSRSPEGRVKGEGASRGYEFSSEESEGEEDNREVKDDPLNSDRPPIPYLPLETYPADSSPPFLLL